MGTTFQDFANVGARARELGCQQPVGLSLLPRNFAEAESRDQLTHDATGLSIRAALRAAAVTESRLEPEGERWPAAQEDAFEWVGPTLFVAFSWISQSPEALSVALGVVSNYVTELFRGTPSAKQNANLKLVVERADGTGVEITYEGPPAGIEDLADLAHEVVDGPDSR